MSPSSRSATSATGSAAPTSCSNLPGLDEHALGAGLLGARLRGLGELVPGEQQLRAGVAEVEADLALLEQRVHRHDDRAEPQRAEEDEREVRDVGQHQPDAVAGLDALGAQQAGDVAAAALERGVGQHEVVELDRGPVAEHGDRPAIKLDDLVLNHSALEGGSRHIAGLLRARGVEPGDRVGADAAERPALPLPLLRRAAGRRRRRADEPAAQGARGRLPPLGLGRAPAVRVAPVRRGRAGRRRDRRARSASSWSPASSSRRSARPSRSPTSSSARTTTPP